jgi:hypothetical protein
MVVDHINGVTVDNRRANLRICLHAENARNRGRARTKKTTKPTSVYKGVHCVPSRTADRSKDSWRANLRVGADMIRLGGFPTEIAAAQAYDEAALKYHGPYARLNLTDNNDVTFWLNSAPSNEATQ